jgi:hypothetical protein
MKPILRPSVLLPNPRVPEIQSAAAFGGIDVDAVCAKAFLGASFSMFLSISIEALKRAVRHQNAVHS